MNVIEHLDFLEDNCKDDGAIIVNQDEWRSLRDSIGEKYGGLKNEISHALIDFNHGDIKAGKHRLMLIIERLENES